jgi:hypothetical protein
VRSAAVVAAAAVAVTLFSASAIASTAKIAFVDVGQGDGVVM